jgi:hypothetical protein
MTHIGTGISLVLKTMPIVLVRLGVAVLFGIGLVIYLGIAGGLAWLLSHLADWLGAIVGIGAVISVVPIYLWFSRYVLYVLKAAHVAVIAELLVHGKLPEGVSQVAWGKEQVTARFGGVSVMFLVDELIRGVVRALTDSVAFVAGWLPIPGIDAALRFFRLIVHFATDYVDEAILARAFVRREESVWQASKEGVILYAMAWKTLLQNAVILAVLSLVSLALFWFVLAAPVLLFSASVPAQFRTALIVAGLVLAFLVKFATSDAVALAATIAAYEEATRNMTPDPEWAAKLDGLSSKFKDLSDRAAQALRPQSAGPTPV